ncbi:unnamed protein product [Arabidopsis arenosa]|uniref:Lipoyl-binding domain-containing protein n=1 Tax=Arabidopsis arenosa TaxID=38785 RepID=A0A8S1ZME1_ARAAE|nr:unnamed protein product [Arabidopsis arenosa]
MLKKMKNEKEKTVDFLTEKRRDPAEEEEEGVGQTGMSVEKCWLGFGRFRHNWKDLKVVRSSSKIAMRVRAERPSWYPAVIGGALYVRPSFSDIYFSWKVSYIVTRYSTSSESIHDQCFCGFGLRYVLRSKEISPEHISLVHSQVSLNISGSEVMKMCMPLLSLASRVIHFKTSEGQAMQAGELIAKLDLDDPSAERKEASKHNCRL